MHALYTILLVLALPLVLAYFGIRGLRDRRYLARWRERFGFIPETAGKHGIWVHAASVGEFNAALPLINALLEEYPALPMAVTTLTPTGSDRVENTFGGRIFHSYIPMDLPGAVKRFLGRLQPRVIIMVETEIWPNLFLAARRREIPLLICNARLSQRSVRAFRALPGLFGEALRAVSWFGAQSEENAGRLALCGADAHNVELTGNLKFDLTPSRDVAGQAAEMRESWQVQRPVLVAGSTHEADENVILPAFIELLKRFPDALLVLVPRHPERFARAAQSARSAGLTTELRSQANICSAATQCFVVDAMGELMTWYAFGDVVFVGGSMGEQGGHNALEPAVLGKPILLGPNMDNAKEVAESLLECGAALRVSDPAEFEQAAARILGDEHVRQTMGLAAQAMVQKNRGALKLTLDAVKRFLL